MAGAGAADLWLLNAYQTQSFNPNQGRASFFDEGTILGSGNNGYLGQAFFYHGYFPLIDFTSDQTNKFIGFKTSNNNWGFANVSWNENAKTLTIHDAWVESTPDTAIIVPEPSRALCWRWQVSEPWPCAAAASRRLERRSTASLKHPSPSGQCARPFFDAMPDSDFNQCRDGLTQICDDDLLYVARMMQKLSTVSCPRISAAFESFAQAVHCGCQAFASLTLNP